MGWTFTHKESGTSIRAFFEHEFQDLGFLDTATANRKEFYAACRHSADSKYRPGEVFGLICLLGYDLKSHCNFGYKDMDEGMGPFVHNCPVRIINLLDRLAPVQPTINTYDAELTTKIGPQTGAYEWRQKCRVAAEIKTRAKVNLTSIQPGDVVEFDKPFGGGAGKRFVATTNVSGKLTFRGENGRFYHLAASTLAKNPCSIHTAGYTPMPNSAVVYGR